MRFEAWRRTVTIGGCPPAALLETKASAESIRGLRRERMCVCVDADGGRRAMCRLWKGCAPPLPDQCEILIFHLGARVGGEEQKEAHSTHFILAASAESELARATILSQVRQPTNRPRDVCERVGAN